MVISKVSGLADDSLKIMREKHPQQIELDFFTTQEKIRWDGKFILREGLLKPWAQVVGTVISYLTLNTHMI